LGKIPFLGPEQKNVKKIASSGEEPQLPFPNLPGLQPGASGRLSLSLSLFFTGTAQGLALSQARKAENAGIAGRAQNRNSALLQKCKARCPVPEITGNQQGQFLRRGFSTWLGQGLILRHILGSQISKKAIFRPEAQNQEFWTFAKLQSPEPQKKQKRQTYPSCHRILNPP